MESFKTHHKKYKTLSEEEIQELRDAIPRIKPIPSKSVPLNDRPQHKKMNALWKDFLRGISKLKYSPAPGEKTKKIVLHKSEFSKNDLAGRFAMQLTK